MPQSQRVEDVAGEALRVHPHQDIVLALHRALHEGHVLFAVEQRFVHVAGEVAPRGRHPRLGDPPDELLVLAAVLDQLGDADHQQTVFLAELHQVGNPCHRAVVVDDLAQHAGRVEARQARQVDGCLGVSGPLEHAALGISQWEDVAGPGEVGCPCRRVGERVEGGGPVRSRDARGGARYEIHAVGEGRAMALGVLPHHQGDVQLVEAIPGERRTDHTRGVAHEERDVLGGRCLGRHDEVTLVLTILVVDHHHDLAPADRLHGLFDRGEHRPLRALGREWFA
jgi:hypothetical protein